MTLSTLRLIIETLYSHYPKDSVGKGHLDDCEVVIHLSGQQLGSIPHTSVTSAYKGIDWNSYFFILEPNVSLKKDEG